VSRPISNPYGRGFRVKEHIDRGRTKEARRARDIELEGRAREAVQAVLDGCIDQLRPDLSLALIDATAAAAGRLHDPETVQARLGRAAHENGAAIVPQAAHHAAVARALFKGRAA
jgi:hypothetical protein